MSSFLHRIRNRFFSPTSNLELRFRTLFHRLNSSRLAFSIKDARSKRSYQRNLRFQTKGSVFEGQKNINGPSVSFLLTVDASKESDSIQTIHSILRLFNQEWELVLFGHDSSIKERIAASVGDDDRLVFHVGSGVKPSECAGKYLVFCQPGDLFSPTILDSFYQFHQTHPRLFGYFYDCEYFQEGVKSPLPLCKPQQVICDSLLSVNMLSRAFFGKDFIKSRFPDRLPFDFAPLEFDLSLYVGQFPDRLGHIPEVLVRQKSLMQPDRHEIVEVVKNHLEDAGLQNVTFDNQLNQPHFSWATQKSHVAIVIPTKNHGCLLQTLFSSLDITTYEDYSIYLVDNGSTDVETLDYYAECKSRHDVSIIPYNEPFNYSRAINLGASRSKSDLLLFLNDDMQVIHPGWLNELVQWAQRPKIGVVGTKLLRRNRTIQHAGIVVGLNDFVGHVFLNAPEHYHGLFGSVDWIRNYQALTGACQMVRRSVFEEVDGYDETYRLAFGDVDFCLKVQELGYRNVYTPFAYMHHLEGKSRGFSTPIDDIVHGYDMLESTILTPDPNYSERLSLSVIPEYLSESLSREQRLARVEERKRFYLM